MGRGAVAEHLPQGARGSAWQSTTSSMEPCAWLEPLPGWVGADVRGHTMRHECGVGRGGGRRRPALAVVLLALGALCTACATLRQLAALQQVRFSIARVSGVRLAGIDVSRVRSYRDLSVADAGSLARAVARDDLPLELEVHLRAENPADNAVSARLLRMDWTLL